MRRSTSRSSTTKPAEPEVRPLGPLTGLALSVDVEEWYHSCWVPEYVDPARRPPLVEELDRLLPALIELLAELESTATFFVLGEVARRHPRRLRELAGAGHEVACHLYGESSTIPLPVVNGPAHAPSPAPDATVV